MDTVTQVLEHPQYKACCETITDYEADRTYCRHDMEHFLRVGQIAILLAKENGLSIDAEEIMLAARGSQKTLEDLLSFADHFSRECFACLASDTCKWKAEERIDRPYFEIKEDYDIRKRGLL